MVIFIEIIKRQAEKRMQKKKQTKVTKHTQKQMQTKKSGCIKNIKLKKESM